MRRAVDAPPALPGWQLPDGDVAVLVESLAVEASRLAAVRLRLLAEAEERRVGTGSGFITTGAWLTARTPCRLREAGSTVALATALTVPWPRRRRRCRPARSPRRTRRWSTAR